jgi:hypothetical protein
MKKLITCLTLLLFTGSAMAGPFSIINRSYPTAAGIQTEVNAAIDSAFDDVETQVNAELPDTSGGVQYTDAMSNAAVMTGKGLGVDYASDMELFMVGARVGVGVDVGDQSFGDLIGGDIDAEQISGFGAGVALAGGLNLGMFDWSDEDPEALFKWSDMNLFFNLFKYSHDKDEISADITNFGVHLQYKLMDATTFVPFVFTWTGVQITTGYEYSSFNVGVNYTLTENFEDTVDIGGSRSVTSSFEGTAGVNAEVTTHSIPIEVSTGMQLLYFMTLYGGLGTDISFGSASVNASVDGTVDAAVGGAGITGNAGGTAALDLGVDGGPDAFLFRSFVGFQLNAWIAKLNIQLDKGFTNDTYGIKAGLGLVW